MDPSVVPTVVCVVFTLVLCWLLHFIYKWMHNPACSRRLPPGSMGLPIVGETFQFFKSSPFLDIPDFYKLRFERYGPLFKTSLIGKPVVISMDMEINRFIFRQDKLFQLWYPDAANSIIGKKTITSCYGSVHKYMRSIAAPYFAPRNLKEEFISEIESVITDSLGRWATKPSIEVNEAVMDMMFDLVAKKLIGFEPKSEQTKELRKQFDVFFKGLMSFPLYVPGTRYYRSMQGRKYVQKVIKYLLRQRICGPKKQYGDFLDIIVEELQSGNAQVDENFMVDLIAAIILASTSSIGTILTIAMKILTDHPNVVQKLMEEHEAILYKRRKMESRMTWEELKSLKFTAQVTNEVARLTSNGPGIFRKTLSDVQVKGYTIPAGWLVMISPVAVHLNPAYFEDPLTFNPWRWQVSQNA
ncbi:unnamed protein product [Urochloa humidicola]